MPIATVPNGTFTSVTFNGPFVGAGGAGFGIGHPPAWTTVTVLPSSGAPNTSYPCINSVSFTPDGDLVIDGQW